MADNCFRVNDTVLVFNINYKIIEKRGLAPKPYLMHRYKNAVALRCDSDKGEHTKTESVNCRQKDWRVHILNMTFDGLYLKRNEVTRQLSVAWTY